MSLQCNLSKNASHRVMIETESTWLAWKIGLLLMIKYRFNRKGRYIPFVDQTIYYDYVKADLKINSGWDIWMGYDWGADNEETDEFLTEFYRKHLLNT